MAKTFTYQTSYGSYPGCFFKTSEYPNGNSAVWIENSEGWVADVTVRTNERLNDGEIAVKNYSENAGMNNWLKLFGFVVREDPIRRVSSGWVEIPIQRMTDKMKKMIKAA